jgi:hypothetical protein
MIRTPDQRVRVFVSSTLEELAAERQAVTTAITPGFSWTWQNAPNRCCWCPPSEAPG